MTVLDVSLASTLFLLTIPGASTEYPMVGRARFGQMFPGALLVRYHHQPVMQMVDFLHIAKG